MRKKNKISDLFYCVYLVLLGFVTIVDVHANGSLGKLLKGEGKWARFWKPNEMYRVGGIRHVILNLIIISKAHLKELNALNVIRQPHPEL